MAETDPVEIVVEIVDSFSDDLKDLRQQLERLDQKDVTPDFDIDDEGDIESLKAQLQALRESLEAELNVDTDGVARAEAELSFLTRDRTVDIDTDTEEGQNIADAIQGFSRDTINRAVGNEADLRFSGMDMQGIPTVNEGFENALSNSIRESVDNVVADVRLDRRGAFGGTRSIMGAGGAFDDFYAPRFPEGVLPGDDLGGRGIGAGFGEGFDFDIGFAGRGFMPDDFDVDESFRETTTTIEKMSDELRDLVPSMRTWMNIVAALIPMLITLAGGAVGVAAALGAVATAGAAMLGLGLLGWGDSFSESMQNAQREAKLLGRELFNVFQPAAQTFQPIMEDWMEGAPGQLQQLVGPLQELVVYTDELEAIGAGLVDWVTAVIDSMSKFDDMAGQVLLRFGQIIGNFIISAMENMLQDVHKNQDAYIKLGSILTGLVVTLFNVFKTISFVIAQFSWVVDIVQVLSGLLSNKFIVAILTFISTLVLTEAAVVGVALALSKLKVLLLTGFLRKAAVTIAGLAVKFYIWAASVWSVNAALAATLGLLAAITGGAILLGTVLAGSAVDDMSGPGRNAPGQTPTSGLGGGYGGQGDTFVIQGDVREREMDRIRDLAGNQAQREDSFNQTG